MLKSIFILFISAVFSFAQKAETVCNPSTLEETHLFVWAYNKGDSTVWAVPTYNDSNWETIYKDFFYTENEGIHWLRTKVIFRNGIKGFPLILRLGRIQSAFEVYWNGVLIGSNGTVGSSKEEETPGQLFFAVSIDSVVVEGENVLSIRYSNFNQAPPGKFFYAKIDSKLNTNLFFYDLLIRLVFNSAVYIACAVFGLALYFSGNRYKNYLYYFLLSVAFLASTGFRFLMHYYNISMGMLNFFEPIFLGGYYIGEISIILFILFSFKIPHRKYHIIIVSILFLSVYVCSLWFSVALPINYEFLRIIITPYIFTLLIYSCVKKKRGSYFALAGYFVYSLPLIVFYYLGLSINLEYLHSRIVFLLTYVMVAARQVQEQQEIQKTVELRVQHLEIELLKKTIQPHFIMNTLASIKSLAKRKPEAAENLVNALATEFRLMNKISSEKEIPLTQEIELCRQHLEVMGNRWEGKYHLHVENINDSVMIPPLIFHTLIENGLTHAFNPKEDGDFWLRFEEEKDYIKFSLKNNGSLVKESQIQDTNEIEEGTGIKYVKARLEERYPGKWELKYGINNSLWEVIIKIKKIEK